MESYIPLNKKKEETSQITNLGACLDPKYFPKFHYAKIRFSITSKYRHMHEVLNVDEIKN
jgi:hypothetical protein